MDVVGAQYVSVKSVNCETTVDDFKSSWLAQEKLDATSGLVGLRLVPCTGEEEPTHEQEAAATVLPPRKTLAQAGVVDGSWLLAVTVSPGECGRLTCFPRRAAHAPDSAATQSTVTSRAPRAAQSGA